MGIRKGGLGEEADEKPGLQVPCPMTPFHHQVRYWLPREKAYWPRTLRSGVQRSSTTAGTDRGWQAMEGTSYVTSLSMATAVLG